MPIGKNAINRVKNNGYSNVETKAPDMENSVIANPDPQVVEKMVKPVEEKTAKKAPAKKTAAKKTASKKTAAKKPAAKKTAAKKSTAKKSKEA
jgi:topoisomerase IA-like protein